MEVLRVEKHKIKKSNKYYDLIDNFLFMSKNLYNQANYIFKEALFNNTYINYNDLDKQLKCLPDEYNNYRKLGGAQTSQQILKLLEKNWKSFFKSAQDYKNNPNKYKGKPKIPKYLKKDGRYLIILTNQQVKLDTKNNLIRFPKTYNNFTIKTKSYSLRKSQFIGLQQVRLIPKRDYILVEVIFKIKAIPIKEDNKKYLSIDLGLKNLAAITSNINLDLPKHCKFLKNKISTKINSLLISGKALISKIKYYENKLSYFKSKAKIINKLYSTKRIQRLYEKKINAINNFLYKVGKFITYLVYENDINTVIIGYNKEWKQESHISENQSFQYLPFKRLIEIIKYNCEEAGIIVLLKEESYTSGTSFLDNEEPNKINYNKNRRIKRGLFETNKGIKINSDINASLQILKKHIGNYYYTLLNILNPIKIKLKY